MSDAPPPLGEDELLELALERPPAERETLLSARCPDAALRERVLRLAGERERAATQGGARASAVDAPAPAPLAAGEAIGPYRLVEKLGEGGMGAVYLAEQTEPIRRRVALKVVRAGLAGEEALARFHSERRTLALMDHPGIARIFDSGTTAGGQPWFAMEHVPGSTLLEHCEERALPQQDRLRLFADVCLAVQHAHQKGVVHRDLKPSNVLVVEVDGRPVPKVIDFGIAKAVDPSLSLDLALTQDGQLLGTLAYMSPEQLSGSADAVDTQSDVYALGVILYRLLSGAAPVDLEGLSLSEAITALVHGDAPRLRSARPDVDADLDVIAGKALEREKARRYASAAELAEDVRRFLADEPILARPPSTAYQLRKLARRHRAAVVGGALTAAAVLAGLTASTALWLRERDARREADALYDSEREARGQVVLLLGREREARERVDELLVSERAAREEVDRSFGVTREVVELLGGLIGTAPDDGAPSETVTLASALERGERTLGRGSSRRSPEAMGWVHGILGNAFLTLGRVEDAERNLAASLATPATSVPARVRALLDLGTARLARGDLAGADAATAEGLELARSAPGPESLELVRALASRSFVLRHANRLPEARGAAEELLALTDALDSGSADTVMHRARAHRLLGEVEIVARRPDLALAHLRESLAEAERSGAEGTIEHAQILDTLAVASAQVGDPAAVELSARSLAATEAIYGRLHGETASALSNHAGVIASTGGDFDEALAALREAVSIERALGDEHLPSFGNHLTNLAAWLLRSGRPDDAVEAEGTAGDAVVVLEAALGTDHPDLATALSVWARARTALGEPEGVVELHRRALDVNRRALGPHHYNTILEASFLGRAAGAAGDWATAAGAWREAFAGASAAGSPLAPQREAFRAALRDALLRAGDAASRAEAEAL